VERIMRRVSRLYLWVFSALIGHFSTHSHTTCEVRAAPPEAFLALSPSARDYFGRFAERAPEGVTLEAEFHGLLDERFRPFAREVITEYDEAGAAKSQVINELAPRTGAPSTLSDSQRTRIMSAITAALEEQAYRALPDVRRLEIRDTVVEKVTACLGTVPGQSTTEADWQVHLEDLRRRVTFLTTAPVDYPIDPELIATQLELLVGTIGERLATNGGVSAKASRTVVADTIAKLSNSSWQFAFKAPISAERLESLRAEMRTLVETMRADEPVTTVNQEAAALQRLAPISGRMLSALVEAYSPAEARQRRASMPKDDPVHAAELRAAHDRVRTRQRQWLEERRKAFELQSAQMFADSRMRTAASREGVHPPPTERLEVVRREPLWYVIIAVNVLVIGAAVIIYVVRRMR
jgi:hypothetical protein